MAAENQRLFLTMNLEKVLFMSFKASRIRYFACTYPCSRVKMTTYNAASFPKIRHTLDTYLFTEVLLMSTSSNFFKKCIAKWNNLDLNTDSPSNNLNTDKNCHL